MEFQLRLSGNHYSSIKEHLFPGDGKEAVAIVLCGRYEHEETSMLLTHKLVPIPHEECERTPVHVNWKTDRLVPVLEEAAKKNMAILKIHSHPTGYPDFSETDDQSDHDLFRSVFGWCDYDGVHMSAVMLPTGEIFARVFGPDLNSEMVSKISVSGDEILIWGRDKENHTDEFSLRTIQAFGEGTYNKLKQLKIGVVGCSGTGSPTIEQLVRLGVGELVIMDPDEIEVKNLNRIVNSRMVDVGISKVEVIAEAVKSQGLKTKITPYAVNLYDNLDLLKELITCDVLIGCMDSVDGRHLLSQLSNFYLIPYFDIGVRLDADGTGGIKSIVASVHYIQPGKSSLMSRGLYTDKRLFDDGLKRQMPEEFAEREKVGYVHNANVNSPAVISINMQISSMAVNELLNRLHPFKDEGPGDYAKVMMDFCGGCIENTPEEDFETDDVSLKWTGRGDCSPFLRMPELS
ncbi:MAG: ThiF family adenylyltransferase [Crocinitomicaceae bacterium]|nr:ThiF family adenylyltransferase [Crocinitomicaceae bacterium]MCF8433216.1 ThiF family adenylyltransferase [Crocinitomicaceae bacterium]